jgi:transcriptional regulator with XRE-family HTH domain
MGTAEHAYSRGARRAASIRADLGAEIRQARIAHGLSQKHVARAARISRSQLSRIERAENARLSVLILCRLLAVLGMELSARAFPVGQPIRDAAHRALLDRLHARLGPGIRWRYERPVGGPGDLRAWDGGIEAMSTGDWLLGVEAETRVRDIQDLQRRIQLKRRDDPAVRCAILLLADTRHNRMILKANLAALRSDFPIDGAAALRALAAGEHPGGNAIVLL